MELVIVNNGIATTTTLAIAEGTGNEHKAVIQLVRYYLSDLEQFGRVTFEMAPFETAGGTQTREIANLNERQAVLIMSYMKNTTIIRTFKIQLTRQFYEMAEQIKALPARQDPMDMLRDPGAMRHLLLIYTDKVIAQEKEIDALTPKAQIADRIAVSDGLTGLRESAKLLGIPQNKFVSWLYINKWIYRNGGTGVWLGYADKMQRGYLEMKITPIALLDGTEKNRSQVFVTGKGLNRLADIFNVELEAGFQEAA